MSTARQVYNRYMYRICATVIHSPVHAPFGMPGQPRSPVCKALVLWPGKRILPTRIFSVQGSDAVPEGEDAVFRGPNQSDLLCRRIRRFIPRGCTLKSSLWEALALLRKKRRSRESTLMTKEEGSETSQWAGTLMVGSCLASWRHVQCPRCIDACSRTVARARTQPHCPWPS